MADQDHSQPVRHLLDRVRSRWRLLALWGAIRRAALGATVPIIGLLIVSQWTSRAPGTLAVVGVLSALVAAGAVCWGLWPARRVPSDRRLARFIEEHEPALEDRLASAVDVQKTLGAEDASPFAASMVADAGRAAANVDPSRLIPSERLRRAAFHAAAALLLLGAVSFSVRHAARASIDAIALALFPSRATLDVVPGSARLQAGATLDVNARLIGSTAPVAMQLLRLEENDPAWRAADMTAGDGGRFQLSLGSLNAS